MTSLAERRGAAPSPRALIIGTGLIGSSFGLALRGAGWHVTGSDRDPAAAVAARELGAIDDIGDDPKAELALIAVPAPQVDEVARQLLARQPDADMVVTDVAGIKGSICAAIDDPRFIGGHPMAGSEQSGVTGARSDLFLGASWVLTPGPATPPELYGRLLGAVRAVGAQAVSLAPEDHDRLVALVSHLPHLVAASLMNEASEASQSDASLLQLAAGGFRDMTRVAAGQPGIWPDVVVENRQAIIEGLDDLQQRLASLREALLSSDRPSIRDMLTQASVARRALPGQVVDPATLAQVRVPVPDRAGVLAEITAMASELSVSVVDVEIAHSVEGGRGVLIVVVDHDVAEHYAEVLRSRGFPCTVQEL